MDKQLKILIFCEPRSVHSVRWINQLADTGWNIKVVSPVAPNWNYWISSHFSHQIDDIAAEIAPSQLIQFKIGRYYQSLAFMGKVMVYLCKKLKMRTPNLNGFFNRLISQYWQSKLAAMVKEFQPDLIHSLAINQDWRNLCLPVLELKQKGILNAPWMYSSWGTDLTFYPELSKAIRLDVERIIQSVDYYISECKRDYDQAVIFGLRGKYLGALPAFGGIHLDEMSASRLSEKGSTRKRIYIKGRGTEDPVGMAMEIMHALEVNRELLVDYEILIGQATPSIIQRTNELKEKHQLNIQILPYMKNPDDILRFVGSSRLFISYTKNDGLPASLIESMVLGAFPIFSKLLSIEEWINHGKNGFVVEVDRPEKLIECIKQALLDDALVDQAAIINLDMVEEKLEYQKVKDNVISIYQKVADENNIQVND